MSGAERLAGLLPSLWRPESGESGLLARLLEACGAQLDTAGVQVQHVLRAHYADSADAALTDAHYALDRAGRSRPPVNVRDARDVGELRSYAYITDLARLAALLDLPPWSEPASIAETAEEYRERLRDVLAAYRLGLTTRAAIAALVEAALPEDMTAPMAGQLWPFIIEEPAAITRRRDTLTIPQADDVLPPLWRWTPDAAAGAPQVIFGGVAAQDGVSEATTDPLIERYTPGATPAGIGVAWRGTLAPGQSLRLAPAWRSALVRDGALALSAAPAAIPDPSSPADPAGDGPWTAVTGLPAGTVQAIAHAPDGTLWLVLDDAGSPALVRYDGAAATAVGAGAPPAPWHALAVRGDGVYLGTDTGLHRCALWPPAGFALAHVGAVNEEVHALNLGSDGTLACAGADGLALLDADDALTARLLPGVELHAALPDGGRWYLATAQALLRMDGFALHRYAADAVSEQAPDWEAITVAQAGSAQSPLPPVRALAVTPDGWLWLGTAAGLARWGLATALEGGAQVSAGRSTLLHAYPDLGIGAVHALASDHRGVLYVAGDGGLLRATGRDLAQMDFTQGRWLPLGRAGAEYPDDITERPRAHYRWSTADARWERHDPRRGRFALADLPLRTAQSAPCAAWLALPAVVAELGSDDGNVFTPSGAVPPADIVLRVKPDETRVVDGGLPYLPQQQPGAQWRYLQIEPDPLAVPGGRPWWSCEGRLFPPPVRGAAWPGHYRDAASPFTLDARFDDAVWTYLPSARLALEWAVAPAVGVRVHLLRRAPDERVPDAVAARVWQLILRTRAAGVPLALVVDGIAVHQS
jgi:hypothetical protein